MIVVAVWKEAGFFMIFYLAALQTHLARACAKPPRSKAPRAGPSSAACSLPLLMPTTLFVLVNAVINAFRIIDHIVVMTRGGPDNATTLLLYYIYEVGFSFWDTASRGHCHRGAADDHGTRGGRSSSACSGRRMHYR